jgi:hypothetical protein
MISEGTHLELYDEDSLHNMLVKAISGGGWKGIAQPLQLMAVDKYQCYDHGKSHNILKYGQPEAPEILIDTIKNIPIAVVVGKYDRLCGPEDAKWTRE